MSDFSYGMQYLDGVPVMVRDSHLAAMNFSQLNSAFNSIPSFKFLYYVRFVSSSTTTSTATELDTILAEAESLLTNEGSLNNDSISLMVKNITRPGVTFQTKNMNQYNKHRVIQTRSEFDPVTINFHDTVDNRILQMFQSYYAYYYKDSTNMDVNSWYNDVISPAFNYASGWGYEPSFTTMNSGYFFDKVEIYKMYGGYYTMMSLIHPFITKFALDNFDYADSGGINQATMTLNYEGLTFDVQTPIELTTELAQEMGFQYSSYFEPYDTPFDEMIYDIYNIVETAESTISAVTSGSTSQMEEQIIEDSYYYNDSGVVMNNAESDITNLALRAISLF